MALKSYEELIKVDVRQYCEERDGFTKEQHGRTDRIRGLSPVIEL